MRMGNFWIASLLHSLLVLPLPFTSLKEHFWYHVFICPWVLPHFVILLSNPITCIEPTHSYKLTQFISTILTVTYDILNYLVNGLGPFSFIKKNTFRVVGPFRSSGERKGRCLLTCCRHTISSEDRNISIFRITEDGKKPERKIILSQHNTWLL